MENYPYQQPQYVSYEEAQNESPTNTFLAKGIVSTAISSLPIGSIIAIIMAANNRKQIKSYIANGGKKETKVTVGSILSGVGLGFGIGMTIFWTLYIPFIFVLAYLDYM